LKKKTLNNKRGRMPKANGVEHDQMESAGMEGEGMEAEGVEAEGMEAEGVETEGMEGEGMEAEGVEAEGMEGDQMEAEPEEMAFEAGMVEHIRVVTSLIEGFEVSREDVIEMLERTMRQRRMSKERQIDQDVRWLNTQPP